MVRRSRPKLGDDLIDLSNGMEDKLVHEVFRSPSESNIEGERERTAELILCLFQLPG